ncbi:MAG: DNA-3-methyladenine glycosylase [Saprospiraceae bacterium]
MANVLLEEKFYLENDVITIAKLLLGKLLVTNINGSLCSGIIVETEAYRGKDDRGAHSYGQKILNKNKTMFEQGGRAYVYICYGVHPMMNVVTSALHVGDAVLIRAVQPVEGIEIMHERRQFRGKNPFELTNGPGKLAIAFGINKAQDSSKLFDVNSMVQIFDYNFNVKNIYTGQRVGMSPRIGSCAFRLWRFYIEDNKWVSKPKHIDYRSNPKFKSICNI